MWYAEATKTPTCAVAASGALLRAYYSLRRDHATMHDDAYVEEDDEDVEDLPGMSQFVKIQFFFYFYDGLSNNNVLQVL